ncbi:hypothetical protein AUJ69_02170 [Candidatus Woesearchaeota archaeon CG1_02_47_18]|nr:MAG: hypothetical protein AUJ69_02170 [Candidatus Woesearchaeota archaeon CG1_02_47_18]HII29849.1 hypothetical protein [Candidatus Woesearchaeota archaeon]
MRGKPVQLGHLFAGLLLFLVLIQTCAAQQAHMRLLAVTQTDEGYEGNTADLYLRIEQGSGRVFIDTFPLTKIDTQISTRFAKEIACRYIGFDCEAYDFFYTINAQSAIIGGPSAGSAVAALTIAVLKGLPVDESATVTGTINSGGLIGPVGGLKHKIDAAAASGIRRVMIPTDEVLVTETEFNTSLMPEGPLGYDNRSVNMVEYGRMKGVEVMPVSELRDVIKGLSDYDIPTETSLITIDDGYSSIMRFLASDLCNRSRLLEEEAMSSMPRIPPNSSLDRVMLDLENAGLNLTLKGAEAFENGSYYSSASYCFGANIKFHYLRLIAENISLDQLQGMSDSLAATIEEFSASLPEYNTITGLQTFGVVKERILDAKEYINITRGYIDRNLTALAAYNLVYATERFYSARSWSAFFGMSGREFKMDAASLKKSCLNKLSEAEERFQYVRIFFPTALGDTRKEIDYAYKDMGNGDYELCLFKASKAKAEADVVLSVLGIQETQLPIVLERKLNVTKRIIVRESKNGVFPIIGYSYYEYASSLKRDDVFSALLYAEYALELSNMEIYFERADEPILSRSQKVMLRSIISYAFIVSLGLVLGFVVGIRFGIRHPRKKRKRREGCLYSTSELDVRKP